MSITNTIGADQIQLLTEILAWLLDFPNEWRGHPWSSADKGRIIELTFLAGGANYPAEGAVGISRGRANEEAAKRNKSVLNGITGAVVGQCW